MKRLHRSSREGFALLLVLIIVSFAAAIAVLFLLSAKQERASTDTYTQGSRVRQLADTAVNIIIGQINAATREGTAVNSASGPVISWASQPGMIRTYNNGTVNSGKNLSKVYKLYSWGLKGTPGMIEDGATYDPTKELPPTSGITWDQLPAAYTDLNSPVYSTVGGVSTPIYPIFDQNIFNSGNGIGNATNNNNAHITWDFPNELAYSTQATDGYHAATNGNQLPMPVQWMYILQDGTWTFPTGAASNTSVSFDSTTGVTAANPIVGRIAFWTDDECNKVNLNTAGEGAYWDPPKCSTQDEVQFAGDPPQRNEFYRFSGHPATTSLSAIFPEVMGGAAGFSRWNNDSLGSANTAYINGLQLLLGVGASGTGLSPRYGYGGGTMTGSQGGTYPCPYYQYYDPTSTVSSGTFATGTAWVPYTSFSPVQLSTTYMYATPDEAWYSNATGSSSRTGVNAAFSPYLTQLGFSRRLSLLTTNSRAPETTLFNTPRVSVWPLTWPYPNSYYASYAVPAGNARGAIPTTTPAKPDDYLPSGNSLAGLQNATFGPNKWITPQESLLAFASTLNSQDTVNGPKAYYFQRQQLDSPTADFTGIQRNRYLVNYIRGMVADEIPGLSNGNPTSGTLAGKWNSDDPGNADWITLECLDYCRSLVNQVTYDPNSTSGTLLYSFTGTAGNNVLERGTHAAPPLRITPSMLTSSASIPNSNFGIPNAPTPPNNDASSPAYVTQGAFPSLREFAIQFIAVSRMNPAYLGPITGSTHYDSPFYWANLINPGSAFGGLDAGSAVIDGSSGSASADSAKTAYPVGCQTTSIQAYILLDFAQQHDNLNVRMSPNFWVKVTNANTMTINTNNPFCSQTSLVQEFRSNVPASTSPPAAPFAVFGGKTVTDPGATPGPSSYTLCSNVIPVSPTATTFQFSSPNDLTVSVYAPLPATSLANADTDPTGNAAQLICSYTIPMSTEWNGVSLPNANIPNGTLPMPIEPRWNQKQAQSIIYPDVTQYSFCRAEMVPKLAYVSSWSWSGDSISFDSTASNVRDNGGIFKYGNPSTLPGIKLSLDNANTYGPPWMMYASAYLSSSATVVVPTMPPAITQTANANALPNPATSSTMQLVGGFSADLVNRYNASTAATNVPAEGTVAFVSSGSPSVNWYQGEPGSAIFSSASFLSGSGTVQDYNPEGFCLTTPYDTVISCVVDPTDPSKGGTGTKALGDPRLVNNGGVDPKYLKFKSSMSLYKNLDLNGPAPILSSGPAVTPLTPPVASSTTGGTTGGPLLYPRPSAQGQFHMMNSHSDIAEMTGYHLIPVWNTKVVNPTTLANPRTSNVLGYEANNGGTGSQGLGQSLDTTAGLDATALNELDPTWDWTSNSGSAFDGGYVERPDQDYQYFWLAATTSTFLGTPYYSRFGGNNQTNGGISNVTGFSPSRQIPSPIVFGTLPSSMTNGWMTLAFSPNPARVTEGKAWPTATDPGVGALNTPSAAGLPYSIVPDHALLDLFWMPISEPYPVSEEFSTAGKISLNYAMMPFSYIQRKTGLDAALKAVWIYALPDTVAGKQNVPQDYKGWYYAGYSSLTPSPAAGYTYGTHGRSKVHSRYPINVDTTLKPFDNKFADGDIFRSASQICDMWLYPNDPTTPNTLLSTVAGADLVYGTPTNILNWWNANGRLSSDNGREAPYNAIYSRVTTQSNSYTVHWRVQALHKVTGNNIDPTVWNEGFDKVAAELRGSTLIERYIDPNAGSTANSTDPNIPKNSLPDYADPNVNSLAGKVSPLPITYYYKWRIDNETYFQPPP